jgi:hypothetical protein
MPERLFLTEGGHGVLVEMKDKNIEPMIRLLLVHGFYAFKRRKKTYLTTAAK